jgi:hypothetical protein
MTMRVTELNLLRANNLERKSLGAAGKAKAQAADSPAGIGCSLVPSLV